jgi:molybdopterin-guanine dinucleotide biosynthesis protein A
MSSPPIPLREITGLILAGGRATRMGGLDKGLQPLEGRPLVSHAIERLSPQVGTVLINANRHLDTYQAFGLPICRDTLDNHPGPLAGFLAGMQYGRTPYLMTVPCDSPRFPLDLVHRLSCDMVLAQADIAMVSAPEDDGLGGWSCRAQPVFCLIKTTLIDSLQRFMADGGRKIDRWTAQHHTVMTRFDQPTDDRKAFSNANTLAELQALSS